MENQGYEEDRSRGKEEEKKDPIPSLSRAVASHVTNHEAHVYEDIAVGATTDFRVPTEPTADHVLARNLTLPFRRAGCCVADTSNSSVRVTSKEKSTLIKDGRYPTLHLENDREFDSFVPEDFSPLRGERIDGQDQQGRKPGRRRKKDCKHCRSKVANAQPRLPGCESAEKEFCATKGNAIGETNEDSNEDVIWSRDVRLPSSYRRTPEKTTIDVGSTITDASPIFTIENSMLGHVIQATNEGKALLLTPEKGRCGMRVNSIYSQDHWRDKDATGFYADVKEQSPFQRAYSLPVRTQTPSSQNRVNLRRSVRGEPPPHPARLDKHRHGWTLHLARPLEGNGCSRSLIFLLIVLLVLLGVGAVALYIAFEPEKLQIIQQYLRSSGRNSTRAVAASDSGFDSQNDANDIQIRTSTTALGIGILLNEVPTSLPDRETESRTEATTEVEHETEKNATRYCDDCVKDEACVALADEEVPICRLIQDRDDPTGCAGYCLINRQKCHRLDVDAFRCVEMEHYCLDDEWTCLNTLCIPLEKRCDGHMNCYDHSDEYNCACNPETHFQCGNETSCLPLERRCDGKIDCWDATDEINCTLACPLESEFTCSNGQCILKARFCDGLPDCADGSDEPHGCQGRCNKYEFTCQNSRCITKEMRCNRVDDCGDGTDERHCKD